MSRDFLKKFFIYVIVLTILYTLTTLFINYFFVFHKVILLKSFFTTIRLMKVVKLFSPRRALLVKTLFYSQMFILLSFTILFWWKNEVAYLVNIASGKKGDRYTSQGSAKWLKNSKLFKNGYASHKIEDLDVIIGQGNDAIVSGSPDSMKTSKKSNVYYGYKLQKEIGKNPKLRHMMLVGTTGSGKNAGMGTPTLLNYKGSCVIFDPAKENYEDTAGYRESIGYVQYFDPQDVNSTLHYNPLDLLRKKTAFITIDVDNLCSVVIPDNPGDSDPFWTNSARNLMSVFLGYTLLSDKIPENEKNMSSVANLFSIIQESIRKSPKEKAKENLKIFRNKFEVAETEDERADIQEKIENFESIIEEICLKEKEIESSQEEIERLEKEEQIAKFTSKTETNKKRRELQNKIIVLKREIGQKEKKESLNLTEILDEVINNLKEQKTTLTKREQQNTWQGILLEKTLNNAINIKSSSKAENTFSSIVSVYQNALSFFLEPTVKTLMSDTSFRIDDLLYEERPLSLYLCISPTDITRCQKFIQLFISSVFNLIYTNNDEENNLPAFKKYKKDGRHTVLFFLDEFVQLGKFDTIVKNIPYCRKYGIAFIFIIQGITHLEELYGKSGKDAILSNCGVINIKGCAGETQTAEWMSSLLGTQTIILDNVSTSVKMGIGQTPDSKNLSDKEVGRKLMDTNEILTMEAYEQITYFALLGSIKCKKLQYFEIQYFKNRVGLKTNNIMLPYYKKVLEEKENRIEKEKEELQEKEREDQFKNIEKIIELNNQVVQTVNDERTDLSEITENTNIQNNIITQEVQNGKENTINTDNNTENVNIIDKGNNEEIININPQDLLGEI